MQSPESLIDAFLSLDTRSDRLASRLMFFIPFGIWIAIRFLAHSYFWEPLAAILPMFALRICCLATLAVREVLFGSWDRLAALGFAVFALLFGIALNSGFTYLVDGACFIFAARNISFRSVAVFAFCEISAIFAVVAVSSLLGIIPNYVYTRGPSKRFLLGFGHPNTVAAIAFFLICLWGYLRSERYGIADATICAAIAIAVYIFTNSRTAIGVSLALIVLLFAHRFVPRHAFQSLPVEIVSVGFFAALPICTVATILAYDPNIQWMTTLNDWLSNRISLAHNALMDNGIPAFGQKIKFGSTDYYDGSGNLVKGTPQNLVDCAYAKMLVSCGWVFFVIAIALVTLTAWKSYKNGEYGLIIIAAVIVVYGISESYAIYLHMDTFLVVIGGLFAIDSHETKSSQHVAGKHAQIT